MCGIVGIFSNENVNESLIRQMTNVLTHRGPDFQGVIVKNNFGLGHARLSILDLEARSNQPMLDSKNEIMLSYNGEIYNYRELKAELTKKGHVFNTTSDTEVLLKSYEEWGTNAFSRLNGMFAFCLVDTRQGQTKTYLVRDRSGIKPLFYAHSAQKFGFASEIKPLLKINWISKDIDQDALYLFLKHGHVPYPQSIFADIKQLSPGTYIEYKNDQLSPEVNYTNVTHTRPSLQSEEDYLGHFEKLMDDIVNDQIVSDVPVGCFLSGGIDSSILTYYFSKKSKNKLKTFSVGYKEKEFSESEYARIVADHYGTDHHEIIVAPRDLFALINDIPRYYDQPFSDPTLMPTMLLCQKAKEHVSVALSGDGGDEIFFGYVYQEMLHRLKFMNSIPVPIRSMAFSMLNAFLSLVPNPPLKVQQMRKFSEIFQFKSTAEFFSYFIGTIGPIRMDRIATLLNRDSYPVNQIISQITNQKHDWIKTIEEVFAKTFLVDTVLQKTDRASMSCSLEVRVPFLDNRLLDFATEVPFDLKYKNGTKKYLLRKFLSSKLPPEITDRRKQGFSIPLREWIRGDLKFLVDDHLSHEKLTKDPHLNPAQISKLVSEHMNGRANHSHLLWSLISYQMWKEYHLGQ